MSHADEAHGEVHGFMEEIKKDLGGVFPIFFWIEYLSLDILYVTVTLAVLICILLYTTFL